MLEDYSTSQNIELQNLNNIREAIQEAVLSKTEELRKTIIYSVHVLRYGGGKGLVLHGDYHYNAEHEHPVYAQEGEICEGFDETTGRPFPSCDHGLECKEDLNFIGIPGRGNRCVRHDENSG